jgi:hypothetical protein
MVNFYYLFLPFIFFCSQSYSMNLPKFNIEQSIPSHSGVYELDYQFVFENQTPIRVEVKIGDLGQATGLIKFVRYYPLNFEFSVDDIVESKMYNCSYSDRENISCQLQNVPEDPCLGVSRDDVDFYSKVDINLAKRRLKVSRTTYICTNYKYGSSYEKTYDYDYLYRPEDQLACMDSDKNSMSYLASNGLTYFVTKFVENKQELYRLSACKGHYLHLPFAKGGVITRTNERTQWCGGDHTYIFDEFLDFTTDALGNTVLWGLDKYPGRSKDICGELQPAETSLKGVVMTDKFVYTSLIIALPNSDKIDHVSVVRLIDSETMTVRVKIDYKNYGTRIYDVSPRNPPREVLD